MAATGLYHQSAGSGRSVLLLHPGFADGRIWDPQWSLYSQHFHLIRCDMRGFGRSPVRSMPITYALDVAALLDELDVSHAAIIGCSLGARIGLELAIARPDLVAALVLAGAATPEALSTAPEMAAYSRALLAAIQDRGLDAAVELSLRYWVDGPYRTPEQVDPELRAKIASMQRDAFVHTREFAASWQEESLISDLANRLAEISVPTRVLIGELDMDFLHEQARLVADRIPGAQLQQIPDTAHAPNIERPSVFDRSVISFLGSATTS